MRKFLDWRLCVTLRADRTFTTIAAYWGTTVGRVRQIYNEVKGRLRAHLKHGFEGLFGLFRIKLANGFLSVCDLCVTRRLIVTYIVTLPFFKNTELTSHWILVP